MVEYKLDWCKEFLLNRSRIDENYFSLNISVIDEKIFA